jgi:hypothetical protein
LASSKFSSIVQRRHPVQAISCRQCRGPAVLRGLEGPGQRRPVARGHARLQRIPDGRSSSVAPSHRLLSVAAVSILALLFLPLLLPPVSRAASPIELPAHTCTDSALVPQCVTKCPPPDGAVTPVDEHCLLPPGRAERPASAAPRAAARHTVGDRPASARRLIAGPTPAVICPSPRSRPGWPLSGQRSGRAVPDSGRLTGGTPGGAGASHGGERTGSGSSGVGPITLRAMPQSRCSRR